jgi:uncharacterized protein (TIGR02391 family)
MTITPLDHARSLVEEFAGEHYPELDQMRSESNKLLHACAKLAESWSGSFAGWHGRMYFRNFQKPALREQFSGEWGGLHGIPGGWQEKDGPMIAKRINELVGDDFSVTAFEERAKLLRRWLSDLKNEVDAYLAVMDFSGMPKEQQLAETIERLSFGEPKYDHVNSHIPKTVMSRDTQAVNQGITLPGHIYYEAVALEGKRAVELFYEYDKLTARLVKQVTMRAATSNTQPSGDAFYGVHTTIIEKCRTLYESAQYAEAVEKSFKIVRDRLRVLTGHEKGSDAFGRGKLHIKGAAASHVDRDFNEAAKFLMMAIDMFRNEKSHTSDAKIDDPVRAYQYLVMSSLALSLLDSAEIKSH